MHQRRRGFGRLKNRMFPPLITHTCWPARLLRDELVPPWHALLLEEHLPHLRVAAVHAADVVDRPQRVGDREVLGEALTQPSGIQAQTNVSAARGGGRGGACSW